MMAQNGATGGGSNAQPPATSAGPSSAALNPPVDTTPATTSGELVDPSGSNQASTSGTQGTTETAVTQSLSGSNMSARLQQLSMDSSQAGPRPGIWMDPAFLPPPPMLQPQFGNGLLPTPRTGHATLPALMDVVTPGPPRLPIRQRLGHLPPPPPSEARAVPYNVGNDTGAEVNTGDNALPAGLAAFMAATSDDRYFQSVNFSKAFPQIRPYNGSTPLRDFVELIDDLQNNYQLDNRAAGSLARASLEGDAKRYISGLMPYEFTNRHLWRDQPARGTQGTPNFIPPVTGSLTAALWDRFGERISPAETKGIFNQSIPQRPKESFPAYVDRLKLPCRRYVEATYGEHGSNLAGQDPKVYATMFNAELVSALWAGMLPPYRDHLEDRRYLFSTFVEIKNAAIAFELTERGHRLLNFSGNRSGGQRQRHQASAITTDEPQAEASSAAGRGRSLNRRLGGRGGRMRGPQRAGPLSPAPNPVSPPTNPSGSPARARSPSAQVPRIFSGPEYVTVDAVFAGCRQRRGNSCHIQATGVRNIHTLGTNS